MGAGVVWLNGRVVDEADATVPFNDHGLTVGDGVFETLDTVDGRPFAVRRHLERLDRSAAGLGLRPPPAEVLRSAVDEVCGRCPLERFAVRVTVTGGPGPLGSMRGETGPTVVVATMPARAWPPVGDVVVVPWPRNERGALAGLKTTSYGENVVALAYAKERGASEAIFGNLAGRLCEGTGSNVFVGRAGRLVTPPLSSGCLAGVTRALLLELGAAVEEDVPLGALAEADEAFLSSSTRGVQPIGRVDGSPLGAAPGPLSAAAADSYAALVARDLDP